ncbi:MAG: alpha/beta hydrolase, partial [Alphaproteobacteria bacterium]
LYPAVDLVGDYPSRSDFAEGYFLETETMRWFVDRYFPDETARADWRASPLRASDHAGLAPAMVLTAGLDPLRDEGAAYARSLNDAGVAVDETCYEGVIHGFLNMGGLVPEARQALDEVASWIAAQG